MVMPKAASTSIRTALATQLGLPTDSVHELSEFQGLSKRDAIRFQRDEGYLVVGSVRDPVTRLASCWADKVASGSYYSEFAVYDEFSPTMSFDDFAAAVATISDEDAEPHFRSLAYDLVDSGDVIPDLLVDTATLSEDWNRVRARIAWRTNPHVWLPDLPHANAAGVRVPVPDICDRTIRLIHDRYAEDYAAFGVGSLRGH